MTEKVSGRVYADDSHRYGGKLIFPVRTATDIDTANKVAELFEKLYEDNVEGKVTDEWFLQLSHKYEVERMELKEKIAELRGSIPDLDSMQTNKDQFIHAIRKFMEIQT